MDLRYDASLLIGAGELPKNYIKYLEDVGRKILRSLNRVLSRLELDDELLKKAVNHLVGRGKLVRGIFSYILGISIGGEEDKVLLVSTTAELYHTASLIHDDIIDDSSFRRGLPTVHRQYGLNRAIIAGDLLIVYPNYLLSSLGGDVVRIFAEAGINLCDGEALELNYLGRIDEVDLDIYNKIVYKKTASLFEKVLEATGLVAQRNDLIPILKKLGKYLGMAFQYRDDVLDFVGDPNVMGKPSGMDVGKPNLIRVLMNTYNMSVEEALEYSYRLVSRYVTKSQTIVNDIPIGSFYKEILQMLIDKLGERPG